MAKKCKFCGVSEGSSLSCTSSREAAGSSHYFVLETTPTTEAEVETPIVVTPVVNSSPQSTYPETRIDGPNTAPRPRTVNNPAGGDIIDGPDTSGVNPSDADKAFSTQEQVINAGNNLINGSVGETDTASPDYSAPERTEAQKAADFSRMVAEYDAAKSQAAAGDATKLRQLDAFFKVTRDPAEYTRDFYMPKNGLSLAQNDMIAAVHSSQDLNGDGLVSEKELDDAGAAAQYDAKVWEDGGLSKDEMVALVQKRVQQGMINNVDFTKAELGKAVDSLVGSSGYNRVFSGATVATIEQKIGESLPETLKTDGLVSEQELTDYLDGRIKEGYLAINDGTIGKGSKVAEIDAINRELMGPAITTIPNPSEGADISTGSAPSGLYFSTNPPDPNIQQGTKELNYATSMGTNLGGSDSQQAEEPRYSASYGAATQYSKEPESSAEISTDTSPDSQPSPSSEFPNQDSAATSSDAAPIPEASTTSSSSINEPSDSPSIPEASEQSGAEKSRERFGSGFERRGFSKWEPVEKPPVSKVEAPATYTRDTSDSGFAYPWSAARSTGTSDIIGTISKALSFMNSNEGKDYRYDKVKGAITTPEGNFISKDDVQALNNVILKYQKVGFSLGKENRDAGITKAAQSGSSTGVDQKKISSVFGSTAGAEKIGDNTSGLRDVGNGFSFGGGSSVKHGTDAGFKLP